MCTSFKAPLKERLAQRLQLALFDEPCAEEVYIGYRAPMLRRSPEASGGIEMVPATFGLIPAWSKDEKQGRFCYNARTETVAEKPSFKTALKRRQFSVTPMTCFYEPFYETAEAKSQRWAIRRPDHDLFFVAGLYDKWTKGPVPIISFTLFTVNADHHPVMGRFHKWGDEKRSLVILTEAQIQPWLAGNADDAFAYFTTKNIDEFTCASAPLTPRANRTQSAP